MAFHFPYTHYACPCVDQSAQTSNTSKRTSLPNPQVQINETATFNPHDPRANFNLYPLEHLLYCDECDSIRCPRCYTEEVLSAYCPSCLFETPSSSVKSDGNRCARNCFDCPQCSAPLTVAGIPQRPDTHLKPGDAEQSRYILQCGYCDWTSLELGMEFAKPTKIAEQLHKKRKARQTSNTGGEGKAAERFNHDEVFTKLTTFCKDQLSESGDAQNPYSNSPYSSPANLARIMSIYGGLSASALKKSREKSQPMREALTASEGLNVYDHEGSHEMELLQRLRELDWNDTATIPQRQSAPYNNDATTVSDLWPAATRLRIRRGKRCSTCRQFLSRPDSKIQNLRYKIRLIAQNHIPRLSVQPLHAPTVAMSPAFPLSADHPEQPLLQPHIMRQYVLTIRNPIFESVKITMATPSTTPGKVASRVTILCPSFTVGPAGDVWDEALSSGIAATSANDGGRQAAMASLTGRSADEADRQPEAGKIWDSTRNSTSVILEVIPGSQEPPPSIVPKSEEQLTAEQLGEDDDVLEIPIFVRAEWEAEEHDAAHSTAEKKNEKKAGEGEKIRKELAYWCVLGLGRVG